MIIGYLYSYYNADSSQARFFSSSNFALPTKLFHQIGGFDTTFPLAAGEDREFCDRWRAYGYSMQYMPEAIVYHSQYLTLRSFWQKHFNYGRGAFHFHQVRAKRRLGKVEVEPFSFYLNLLAYPFSQGYILQQIMFFCLFFVSQVAIVAGFFWERVRR